MSILDYIKIIETKAPQLHDVVLIKVEGQDYTLIFHDLKHKNIHFFANGISQ
jgi:hypothetical protein